MDSKRERTRAAIAANVRRGQERLAERLREAGWTCIPPESREVITFIETGNGARPSMAIPGQLTFRPPR
jgi:hypothetical protein